MTSHYRWVILATGAVGAGAFSALRMGLPAARPRAARRVRPQPGRGRPRLRGRHRRRDAHPRAMGRAHRPHRRAPGHGQRTGRLRRRPRRRGARDDLRGAPRRPARRGYVRFERDRRVGPRGHGLVRAQPSAASPSASVRWRCRSAAPLASLTLPQPDRRPGLDAAFVALAGLSLTAAVASVVLMRDPPPRARPAQRERARSAADARHAHLAARRRRRAAGVRPGLDARLHRALPARRARRRRGDRGGRPRRAADRRRPRAHRRRPALGPRGAAHRAHAPHRRPQRGACWPSSARWPPRPACFSTRCWPWPPSRP